MIIMSFPSSSSTNSNNVKNIYSLSDSDDDAENLSQLSSTKEKNLEDTLSELLKKYNSNHKSNSKNVTKEDDVILLSDSSNDSSQNNDEVVSNEKSFNSISFDKVLDDDKVTLKKLDSEEGNDDKESVVSNEKSFNSITFDNVLDDDKVRFKRLYSGEDDDKEPNVKKSRKKNGDEKKAELEQKKAMKQKEKALKKELQEQEKIAKQAKKIIEKCHKPDDCLKYIIVNMDNSIFNNKDFGNHIKEHLSSKSISFREKCLMPGVLSWTRKELRLENMSVKEEEVLEKHIAVIIKPTAFGNLALCIRNIKDQIDFKHLTIFVFGQSNPTPSQEDEILEIEMNFSTYWQFVKNIEELGNYLFMLTKSIALIPYKLKQEEEFIKCSSYLETCNKKVVKVDKDGNGMGQLWRQMLTMFPLVRLETAEAITSVYPTLNSLLQAYNCVDSGEELIQNLPIRRAQGPFTANKKLGPELSKKCYRFFSAEENVLL